MENSQNKTLTEEERKALRLKRFGDSALANTQTTKVKLIQLKIV